jgi:hypothetical protein
MNPATVHLAFVLGVLALLGFAFDRAVKSDAIERADTTARLVACIEAGGEWIDEDCIRKK